MHARKTLAIVAMAALVGWFANDAFTEDEEGPSEAEIWAKMAELGKPTEAHDLLARLEGDWNAEATFVSAAGELKSEATSANELFGEGRFLMIHYKGDLMGQAFEGHGIMGHDNLSKKYQIVWVDSMSSAISFQEGSCSGDKSTLTFTGTQPSPWGDYEQRMVYTFKSDDEWVLEAFGKSKGSEEPERKEMTIVYKRTE